MIDMYLVYMIFNFYINLLLALVWEIVINKYLY
jgi:hypothetical protein